MIAVGLGRPSAPGRSRSDGSFAILQASDLQVMFTAQETAEWITEVRFSPDSSLLASATEVRAVLLLASLSSLSSLS
jgi:hypothetical protein